MVALVPFLLSGCAQGLIPQTRNVNIPAPQQADTRQTAINEQPDSVIYLPLGRDVLVPEMPDADELPDRDVGPFELRGETLGGALQLILADVDIPIAFQTDLGLTRTVTVTNLKGNLSDVVNQVCALADLYCSFERGALIVKETQSFTVVVPPIGEADARTAMMTSVSGAIQALTGSTPVVDAANRTIIYQATNRSSEQVNRYFQRMRASTSMIVYETYIWEVSLDAKSAAGIQWDQLQSAHNLNFGVSVNGTIDPSAGTPVSIGLPTSGSVNFSTGDVLKFISGYGAVKTISQPQLTVLSGSSARLRVADTQNYVSEITRTVSGDQVTVSLDTDSVDSGFTLQIASGWDNATVYGNINIQLQEVRDIETFDDNEEAIVQLPQTTEREVATQVRIRPGDSLLIAGLVREVDNMSKEGIGIEKPILPTSRSSATNNVELVFLLKPRVVAFTDSIQAHVRTPVDADTPAPDVALLRYDQQAGILLDEQANIAVTGQSPEGVAVPIPVARESAPLSADMPVVTRLFDDTAAPLPIVPPVEQVQNAPLPDSAVKSTVIEKKKPVIKKTAKKKSPVKRKVKPIVKKAPVAESIAAPVAETVAPNPAQDVPPEKNPASSIADKVLTMPDSNAPVTLPNDLPPLTDGTVLPPASAFDDPTTTVTTP